MTKSYYANHKNSVAKNTNAGKKHPATNLNHQNQNVLPIKDTNILLEVEKHLKDDFELGMRNYTIFQTGKATLLRVSDVLNLKKSDVYDSQGHVKRNAHTKDIKTGKNNVLYLKPITKDLEDYYDWLQKTQNKSLLDSLWLFPSQKDPTRPLSTHRFYVIMQKVGKTLGISYLGTHTMRKTGAYRVYVQSGYNIALVMRLLNHSSEEMTLKYLGLDRVSIESMLDKVNFS